MSRRRVLKVASCSVASLGASGLATAKPDDLVEVNVGVTSDRGRKAATRAASEVVRDFDSLRVVTIRVPRQALDGLRRRGDVRYVERNGVYRASGETTPWGVDRIDADVACANAHDGDGADVAILDTGIDDDHADLSANVGAGEAFVTCQGSNCNYDWSDDDGHGTHCAGVASAQSDSEGTTGVGPQATLHAVKVLDSEGYGSWSDIAAGIERVADRGWDVANMSFGGASSSRTVADACAYANSNGVLLVAAAGNVGPCSDCVEYPAKYPECVAVSATNADDALAEFSSTGPEVELAAPGKDVYSTVIGGYAEMSGTSMAAPHVSGVAAALMAEGRTSDAARDHLRNTAESLGLSSREQGRGLVDAAAATAVGERGRLSIDQPDRGTWFTEGLERSYGDAVAVGGPLSYDGGQPSHVRVCGLRDVDEDSFRYKLEEWDYLDGAHVAETADYLVFEAGNDAAGDLVADVGTVQADHTFSAVEFSAAFAGTPVVLTQSQTRRGNEAVVTRNRNVSTDGFDVALAEQESKGPHRTETVGYLAFETGVGTVADTELEVGRTANAVEESWHRIDFEKRYEEPHLVADLETYHGPDTAGLRYRNLTGDGVDVKVEEETSADGETNHGTEVVGYVVAEGTGLL